MALVWGRPLAKFAAVGNTSSYFNRPHVLIASQELTSRLQQQARVITVLLAIFPMLYEQQIVFHVVSGISQTFQDPRFAQRVQLGNLQEIHANRVACTAILELTQTLRHRQVARPVLSGVLWEEVVLRLAQHVWLVQPLEPLDSRIVFLAITGRPHQTQDNQHATFVMRDRPLATLPLSHVTRVRQVDLPLGIVPRYATHVLQEEYQTRPPPAPARFVLQEPLPNLLARRFVSVVHLVNLVGSLAPHLAFRVTLDTIPRTLVPRNAPLVLLVKSAQHNG